MRKWAVVALLLAIWAGEDDEIEPRFPEVWVPDLDIAELFDDIFVPIARDGAGVVEVQVRLQKALAALARTGDPRFVENARRQSEQALERAALAMDFPNDIGRARAAAAMVGA